MSSKLGKTCKCKGKNEDCPICEGTGIILYDENFDDASIALGDKKWDSELEEDE